MPTPSNIDMLTSRGHPKIIKVQINDKDVKTGKSSSSSSSSNRRTRPVLLHSENSLIEKTIHLLTQEVTD